MNIDNKMLLDWAEYYFKHRDLIHRKISTIERKPDKLQITNKDNTSEQVIPVLKLEEAKPSQQKATVVTLNTKTNFEYLIKNWVNLAKFQNLMIIFVNPGSDTEQRWIIKPYVHNKVSDSKTLKQGLKTMFETVEKIII